MCRAGRDPRTAALGRGCPEDRRDGNGAVVVDPTYPAGAVVGRVDPALLRDVLADVPDDFELIVQMEALREAQDALPDWMPALPSSTPRPTRSRAEGERRQGSSSPPHQRSAGSSSFPATFAARRHSPRWSRSASWPALSSPSAQRATSPRRSGTWASTRSRVTAARVSQPPASGRSPPTWPSVGNSPSGANEDNVQSLELARKLGFQPVDRVAVLSRPPLGA